MATEWRMVLAGVLAGFTLLLFLPQQAAAHCSLRHPHHCVKDVVEKTGDIAEEAAKKVEDEVLEPAAHAVGDGAKKVAAEAKRAAEGVEDEVLEPAAHAIGDAAKWVEDEVLEKLGDLFEGDFEVCDCSKTMKEQKVSMCVQPTPDCSPDSAHKMGRPKSTPEEILETDICGLIRYVRRDGDNTIYRGIGFGSVWIIESDDEKIVTALKVHISPNENTEYSFKANQGWVCV